MPADCRICLGPCTKSIHEATLRIRAYLRERVTFEPPAEPVKRSNPAKVERYVPERYYRPGSMSDGERRV